MTSTSSRASEKEMASSLTAAIVETLEAKFDRRIKTLEHIVLRQKDEIADLNHRLKSLGRVEQQVNRTDDRLATLNREIVVKQACIDRLGSEQGVLWESCNKNFQLVLGENKSHAEAIKNLQRAVERQPATPYNNRAHGNETRSVSVEVCSKMIDQENQRLMELWSKQFDELASFVHSTLDCQTTLISKVQSKTLALTTTSVSSSQDEDAAIKFDKLATQLDENTDDIRQIKEDQKVAVAMFVETITNMKMKYDYPDDFNLIQYSQDRAGSFDFKRSQSSNTQDIDHKNDIKKIHAALRILSKETEAATKESDEIRDILEESVSALVQRTNATAERCKQQIRELESRLAEEFVSVRDQKNLEREFKQSLHLLQQKIGFAEAENVSDNGYKLHLKAETNGARRILDSRTPVSSNKREHRTQRQKPPGVGNLIDLTAME